MKQISNFFDFLFSWIKYYFIVSIVFSPISTIVDSVTGKAEKKHSKYASRFESDVPNCNW